MGTIVDILFFWDVFPARILNTAQAQLLPPVQRLNPFSIRGLELNMLGALSGVCAGRCVVAVRELLLQAVAVTAALLPASLLPASFTTSVAARTACTLTASLLRTTS